MRILIAPDSFKESLPASEVAAAIAKGLSAVLPEAELICLPLADGGEGSAQTCVDATGGHFQTVTVSGPLGAPTTARIAWLGDGRTAMIEMAEAAGLALIPPPLRNPELTSTRGVGEMVLAALDGGAEKIMIGLGGSATNDGGSGLLSALGIQFLDQSGRILPDGGAALIHLDQINADRLDKRIHNVEIVAACDVKNPLMGDSGASVVFGPQKGATPEQVKRLDAALSRFAERIHAHNGRDIAHRESAGAAGGLAGGLMGLLNVPVVAGIDWMLDLLNFDALVAQADWVVTGEGRMDGQSAAGKLPLGVAQRAARYQVPTVALVGQLGAGWERLTAAGLSAIWPIASGPMSLETALSEAAMHLERSAQQLAATLLLGKHLNF